MIFDHGLAPNRCLSSTRSSAANCRHRIPASGWRRNDHMRTVLKMAFNPMLNDWISRLQSVIHSRLHYRTNSNGGSWSQLTNKKKKKRKAKMVLSDCSLNKRGRDSRFCPHAIVFGKCAKHKSFCVFCVGFERRFIIPRLLRFAYHFVT